MTGDYRAAVTCGAERLKGLSATPRLDAELLLAHVAGTDRTGVVTRGAAPLPSDVADRFRALLERRRALEPVAYLVGEQEFYGRPFTVTGAVLIPRPETEGLVEAALARGGAKPRRVADIGTGSGCIAVTLACERPAWEIVAVDLSPAALAVAQANARRHGVDRRIAFVQGDLVAPLDGTFDLIVSNPPYVADDAPTVAEGVRRHEPALALFAGADGLDLIRRLVTDAPPRLAPGGWLLMEIGDAQGEAVRGIIDDAGSYESAVITHDLAGLARIAQARRKE
ncbi:MAG: peptide chain release factor N(5)-glutamine methyltransferase [Nitrospinae bacterium]|nr:peptide chain release factor N(5)-glutamine methyltransferase [Nitrospinota bacterium]